MRANLREHLQVLWPELEVVAEAQDGPEALRQIEARQPDLSFLDIQMPGLTGLQVAQLAGERTQVVFVTAFDRYALQAFEAHAMDYVLKPVDPVRLGKVVTRLKMQAQPRHGHPQDDATAQRLEAVLAQLQQATAAAQPSAKPAPLDWLQVDNSLELRLVHVDDVMYFESDHKYTRVVGADCDGLIRLSLRELLAGLDPRQFQQVHRSTVVNRQFIHSVQRNGEVMEIALRGSDTRLRVSESNQHLFRAM
jgi:DNA-binding LytR/AlgR family response regulator